MAGLARREPIILLSGDAFAFFLSLGITLCVRAWGIPSREVVSLHVTPFLILCATTILVFFIAGLYEKHTLILKQKLGEIIIRAQAVNASIAIVFFYFIPYFGITPKTSLFIFLVISSLFFYWWRTLIAPKLLGRKHRKKAWCVAKGKEGEELIHELNENDRYPIQVIGESHDFSPEAIPQELSRIESANPEYIVIDSTDPECAVFASRLYPLLFEKVKFIEFHRMYEEMFDRLPLSALGRPWLMEHISHKDKRIFDAIKRLIDVTAGVVLGGFSLLLYPFVCLAIWGEDRGSLFIVQERIGEGGEKIRLYKFRSMKGSDKGKWLSEGDERVTRVGKFLRSSRMDELPQLFNVLRGDISLIGPRPDIVGLGATLIQEIPYYAARTTVKPGLSGWAQINQEKPPQSIEATRMRLAYDLYYIKNRSLMLELKIILRTLKTIISREGM